MACNVPLRFDSETIENASKWPEKRANNKEYNKAIRLVDFISRTLHIIPFETKSLSSHTNPYKSPLCNTTPLKDKGHVRLYFYMNNSHGALGPPVICLKNFHIINKTYENCPAFRQYYYRYQSKVTVSSYSLNINE